MNMIVCIVPISPMRKEASHRTEMVSQMLFGEAAELLETTRDFLRIRALFDGYEGWCQRTQFAEVPETEKTWHKQLTAEWINTILFNDQTMQVPLGCSIDMLENGRGSIGAFHCSYAGKRHDPSGTPFDKRALVAFSRQYLNTPYLWGGRSVFGIDCSGFVQQVFLFFNKQLPRDSYQQAETGELVGFLQEANEGDLAFFDNEEGRITHVGILLGPDRIIHSSGRVRIDPIDNMGIVSSDTGERTHTLRIIRRING
ncbi:C40 family peptidase [Sediminibacterium soli]|uniref:C40 family peptidase n=1 Tax=Sediminibacterium soli TaxID=2698829 RepID=UPI00137B58F0|nr:C40 family peptidase [Sediminibacterium soli]NCI46518.1 C40 family peptidase [Sediminibacterium soli]